jgi:DNA-binding SARP family transcriptional activator
VKRSVRAAGAQGSSADLRLELEGGFALFSEGNAYRLPLSSQRVLAFLALHDRPLVRVYVAGALWPGSNEARAAASLRTAVWRLQQLETKPVVASATHLALSDQIGVDVRQTIAAADTVLDGPPAATSPIELQTLVEAHDLLPDWYDEWVVMEREYVREQRVRALEMMCESLTAVGRFPDAARAALAAVACEPLRESAQRALIELHIAEGNVGEALKRYGEYASLLRRKLDLAPSARLRARVDELMATNAPLP